ncbi:hypothetical protein HJFPF1_02976 [Paramyrothecium foliicola]|nr:hypothetical protein HJFPF1_02976 [Paramyrothecium foliicola]
MKHAGSFGVGKPTVLSSSRVKSLYLPAREGRGHGGMPDTGPLVKKLVTRVDSLCQLAAVSSDLPVAAVHFMIDSRYLTLTRASFLCPAAQEEIRSSADPFSSLLPLHPHARSSTQPTAFPSFYPPLAQVATPVLIIEHKEIALLHLTEVDLETGRVRFGPSSGTENKATDRRAAFGSIAKYSWILILFALGFLITFCGASIQPMRFQSELFHAQHTGQDVFHQLPRRQDCNETLFDPTAAANTAAESTASPNAFTSEPSSTSHSLYTNSTATMLIPSLASPEGVSVAISTHTAISVIYSLSTTPQASSLVNTGPSLGPGGCTCIAATETVSVVVTVVPSTLDDATVTGIPSTVTDVNTDLSFTTGLPDVTVPGNPSTITQVETNVSYTTGLPDATVSGSPSTVTDVQTETSLTSGLPDATISGNPSTTTTFQTDLSLTDGPPDATVTGNPSTVTDVETTFFNVPISTVTKTTVVIISDLWGPVSTPYATTTTLNTAHRTITTVYSSLWTVVVTAGNPSQPSSTVVSSDGGFASSKAKGEAHSSVASISSSTVTDVITKTDGTPIVVSTTMHIPSASYPSFNGSASTYIPGTISYSMPSTTATVVVSGSGKKPGPRGLGGSGGTSNLGCTVMIIAAIIFLL